MDSEGVCGHAPANVEWGLPELVRDDAGNPQGWRQEGTCHGCNHRMVRTVGAMIAVPSAGEIPTLDELADAFTRAASALLANPPPGHPPANFALFTFYENGYAMFAGSDDTKTTLKAVGAAVNDQVAQYNAERARQGPQIILPAAHANAINRARRK